MLKIVKTPTMKQFSDYFFTITKWKKKKSPLYFFSRFFGDVIIHKTGTMLATGQGPGATPSGPGSVMMGTVRGVRDHCGCGTGRNELGFKLKYLSEGARRAPEMKRN